MVAAYHHNYSIGAGLSQQRNKAVKKLHCLRRGNGFIIDVSCDNKGIRPALLCQPGDLFKNILHILREVIALQLQAYMQIRKVKQLHDDLLSGWPA